MTTGKRRDIQGLRALAVALVVAYHVRPEWVPGGFVGVDVFFVISGFLITRTLLAEAEADGRIVVPRFWARRIRRLLPAATTVIVVVLIGMTLFSPIVQWPSILNQAMASAISGENWYLAFQSVDYLHAAESAGPLQHFWSLSVEEQFYIVWPFLLMGLALLGGARRQRAWRIGVLVLIAVFFVWSIVETALSPSTAYFSTATRAWELLIGAALACWGGMLRPSTRVANGLLVGGIVLIGVSAFLLDNSWPFPSWVALIPTLGAASAIASGLGATRTRWLVAPLEWRPVTYLGDISYSLYLWHWPVIVFLLLQFTPAPRLPLWAGAVAVVLSVALAALSTRFIEDPFRTGRFFHRGNTAPIGTLHLGRTFLVGALLLALSFSATGAAALNYGRIAAQIRVQTDPRNFPGARVLDPHYDPSQWNDVVVPPYPDPITLQTIDRQFTPGCLTLVGSTDITQCDWGDPNGSKLVVIVGDSHAAQWAPAYDELGKKYHWRVVLIGKQYCTLTSSQRLLSIDPGPVYTKCADWNRELQSFLPTLHPDLIVQGALAYGYPNWIPDAHSDYDAEMARGYAGAWTPLLDQGIPIVAMEETPQFTFNPPQCLGTPGKSIDDCSQTLASILARQPSRIVLAAQDEPRVGVIDPSPGMCPDGTCRPEIGNVLVYRDNTHLSAPFAISLDWLLESRLRELQPQLFPAH